ncbi:MAG: hypothetical protein ACJAV5_000944 [Vicingaceae bacterium]|jgi:hypothetical protein
MKKLLFFCVLTFTQILTFGQSERLLRFSAVPIDNDKKALVRWTMAAGSTCLDAVVERSRDNISYQEIYLYPGICGNEDSAQSYSWIDPNPLRISTSFYRLKLDGIEFSFVSEFNFNSNLGEDGVFLFPNPSGGVFNLEFTNPTKEKFDIFLFKPDGTLIFTDDNLSGDSYYGNFSEFPTGIYFLKVALQNKDSRTVKLFIR